MPGPEVTVNAFSVDGRFHPLTVTDRLTADGPAFGVALAHAWPSVHPVEGAVEAARRAAEALGVTDGPTYTQIVLGPDGPRVMELAARLGGGHDAELCHAALGIDLNGLALAAALGEPVEIPEPEPAGGACVRFLVPPEGTLADVEGVEEALAVEGVLDARVYRQPGWRFGPFRRGNDRAGFVLARGDSRDDALARADRAAELIRLRTVMQRLLLGNPFRNERLAAGPRWTARCGVSVAPVASGYERALRPCLALDQRTPATRLHSGMSSSRRSTFSPSSRPRSARRRSTPSRRPSAAAG